MWVSNIQITLKLPTTKKNRRNEHLLGRKEECTAAMRVVNGGWCGNLAVLQKTTAAEAEEEGEARRRKTNYGTQGSYL